MNVAQQLVECLVQAGIDTVFTVPGGASSAINHALTIEPRVRMIVCQNETTAGYAATGWQRATGRPGVLVVTSGPGALACCAALAAARLDDDGIVVIAGDVSNRDRARGTLQDGGVRGLSLGSVMAPLANHVVRIEHAHQAAASVVQALRRATATRPQATFLEIPIDVQQAPAVPSAMLAAEPVAAIHPIALAPLLEVIARGARPTLFVGRRVARTATGPLVARLAEALGAPVLVDAEARAVLAGHPWRVGTYGIGDDGQGDAWLRAHPPDPLIVIGARLDDTTTAGFSAELLGGTVVQIDDVEEHIARAGAIHVGVLAPLPAALVQLLEALPPRVVAAPPPKAVSPAVPAFELAPFDPRAAVAALQRAFEPNVVFTSDIGNHLLAALQVLEPRAASGFQFSLGLGGMGSGIGLAIGLAFAGGARVVGLCGDGGVAMFGNELLTAVAHELPLVLAVFQDGQLGMVRHGHERVYGTSEPYRIGSFDIVAWARALGARAEHIHSERQLRELAQDSPSDGPLVLVFPIDPDARVHNPRDKTFNFTAPS